MKSSPKEIKTMINFEHMPDQIAPHSGSNQMAVSDIAPINPTLALALQHISHDLVFVLLNDPSPADFLD